MGQHMQRLWDGQACEAEASVNAAASAVAEDVVQNRRRPKWNGEGSLHMPQECDQLKANCAPSTSSLPADVAVP